MAKISLKVLAVVCLSAFPLMVGLAGCVGGHHPQSTDQRIEDSRTAERVREVLAAGAKYKYDEVTVVAGNGVVQLNGLVNTRAQKTAAGEIVSKVVGVKDVVNNLAVKD